MPQSSATAALCANPPVCGCADLTALSSHLALCTNLRILDLSHNQLASLSLLTAAAFPHLHTLHAHHNRLTSLGSLAPLPALATITTHHNPLVHAVEWREQWQSVDGHVKRADCAHSDAEWRQHLASAQCDEAASVAARTRSARPAVLQVGVELTADESGALPKPLLAKSNMDKEKLRGMLEVCGAPSCTCGVTRTRVWPLWWS